MSPVFTRLLIFALLLQTTVNPAADKGVITGRLLTIDGTPAVSIRVMAMAITEPAAAAAGVAVAIVSLSETDSAGRYRLENIPAGKYYITAGLTDLPTYYPGAVAAATAKVISVAPGSITNGIDFSMQRGTGVRVAGRLAVLPTLKPSTPARAMLSGAAPPTIDTAIKEDGTFVFPTVRPGTYTLRTSVGLNAPAQIVVNDRDVNVVIGADAKGVRVIGKAVVASGGGSPAATQYITLYTSGQSISAAVNMDRTFEFLRVPPGVYSVRSTPGGINSLSGATTLSVADRDITNLEVTAQFLAIVSGTVTVEGDTALQLWNIEARNPNQIASAVVSVSSARPTGSFTLRLSEGPHQIIIRNLPLGYVVKSMTSGDLDLTKSQLDLGPGQPVPEVRIVVGKLRIESIVGVKVSGKVSGLTGAYLSTARVTLSSTDPGGSEIETMLNADGSFEFPKVPTGRYNARLTGPPPSAVTPLSLHISVVEPMSGLQFLVSPISQIQGIISAVDANGAAIAGLPANISIQFWRANSHDGTLSQPGGVFSLMLAVGEYTVTVDRLPAGYTVKSILSGGTDITHAPLKITAAQALTDIRIVLESK